jgi:hypothetical protein
MHGVARDGQYHYSKMVCDLEGEYEVAGTVSKGDELEEA